MKYLATILLVIGLASCAGYSLKNISVHEQLLTLDNTIEATAKSAGQALDNDLISVKTACEIHEYSRLAAALVDQAWNALFARKDDTAQSYVDAARNALLGISEEAQKRAEYHCAGTD